MGRNKQGWILVPVFLMALLPFARAEQTVLSGANTAPPGTPTNLTATTGNIYRGEQWSWIKLSWDKVPGASGYSIYRSTVAGDNPATPLVTGIKTATYVDNGVEGVTYYYKVKATNPDGANSYSNEASATPVNPLFCDRRTYSPLRLTWSFNGGIAQVNAVFPHPILLQRAVLATGSGLLLTEDSGRTWSQLPEGTTEKVGPIRDVAYDPQAVNTFYIASQTKGVWITTDNGKTFRQLGTKAGGMASDTAVSLIVYSGDPSYQTLLAAHGGTTRGLSRTRDGGRTWDVVNTECSFSRIVCGDRGASFFLLIGSDPGEPEIQNLYSCNTVGEFVTELLRDIVPTDLACAPIANPPGKYGPYYLATSSSGLYRIDETQFMPAVTQLEVERFGSWASAGVTWGPNADVMDLFLYDPSRLGLVVSSDNLAHIRATSDGLPVGPLVKEGATVRPNANGTVFYAVVNDALSIGRVPDEVPALDLTPPTFELAPNADIENAWKKLGEAFDKFSRADGGTVAAAMALNQSTGDPQTLYRRCQLTITARLPAHPSPPTSVTVDLSRFGGTPDTPLFDDGLHNDGAAGDGVYGFTFAFLPKPQRLPTPTYEWRSAWPGRVPLGVSATYADGRREGAVGIVGVFTRINDIDVFKGGDWSTVIQVEGEATARPEKNPPEIHKGSGALRIEVRKGHWTVHVKSPYWLHDITSHEAIAFEARVAAGETPKEINLQLRDAPEFSAPTTTGPVPALRGTVLAKEYQRVVVPILPMQAAAPQFQSTHLGEFIFSGDSIAPATLYIDRLEVLARDAAPNPPLPSAK